MRTAVLVGTSAAILLSTALATAVLGEKAQGLAQFAGAWSGEGSVRLSSGVERIRCRGAYVPTGDQLRLNLACASASFKVQIASDMVRQGDGVRGTWNEANSSASGNLTGSIRGDRIDALVNGLGVSGRLSLALHGDLQTVNIVTQSSQISASATITLHRR